VPILLRVIAERQQRDRWLVLGAAHCLGGVRDLGTNGPRAAKLLIDCMKDRDNELVMYAAKAIGTHRLQPDAPVSLLIEALNHPDHRVRFAAAQSLGHFPEQARPAVPRLLVMLNDPEQEVRYAVIHSLDKIAPEALAQAEVVSPETARETGR